MSKTDYVQEGTRQDLVNAKVRLDHAVVEFTQSQSIGRDQRLLASEELHAAVLGLWWRMRPNLKNRTEWQNVEKTDKVDQDVLWTGEHPQTGEDVTITGLADLGEWIDRSSEIQRPSPGPNNASRTQHQEVKVRLPARAALSAAKLLTEIFDELGWGPEPDEQFHGKV